jgi:hypothetical protein
MANQDIRELVSEPVGAAGEEPMPPKARRVLPLVWLTLGVAAVALFVAWTVITAVPPIPREQRLLAVPGADSPATTAHPGPSPAHALPSASDQPAGSTRR